MSVARASATPPHAAEQPETPRFECGSEVARGRVPRTRIAFEGPEDERIDGRRQVVRHGARRSGPDVESLQGNGRRRGSVERPAARYRLVQHDAQRIDVGRERDLPAGDLFRADVLGRPEDHPGRRDPNRRVGCARDPEVDHPHVPTPLDEDIGRLDVAMDDAALVCSLQRAGHVDDDAERDVELQTPVALEDALQILSVDQLHDDEVDAIVRAGVIDRRDVRVVKRGRGTRFLAEPRDEFGIGCKARAEDFHRHIAIEKLVVRPVHERHAALTEWLDQAVAARQHPLGQHPSTEPAVSLHRDASGPHRHRGLVAGHAQDAGMHGRSG